MAGGLSTKSRVERQVELYGLAQKKEILYAGNQMVDMTVGLLLLALAIQYQLFTGLFAKAAYDALALDDKSLPWALYFILMLCDDYMSGQWDLVDDSGIHREYVTSMLVSTVVFPDAGNVRVECAFVYTFLNIVYLFCEGKDDDGTDDMLKMVNDAPAKTGSVQANLLVWFIYMARWSTRLPYLDAAFPAVRLTIENSIGSSLR